MSFCYVCCGQTHVCACSGGTVAHALLLKAVPSVQWEADTLRAGFYQGFPASRSPADVTPVASVVPGWTGSPASPRPGSGSAAGQRGVSPGGGFLFAQEMQLLISAERTAPSTHPF